MHSQAARKSGSEGTRPNVFSSNDKRAMNQGFGDGMSRAFELVVTPLLFGLLGFGIDRAAGTSPVFVIALSAFGVVGTFVRMWLGYDAEMRAHEATGPWAERDATAANAATADDAAPIDLWSRRRGVDA